MKKSQQKAPSKRIKKVTNVTKSIVLPFTHIETIHHSSTTLLTTEELWFEAPDPSFTRK